MAARYTGLTSIFPRAKPITDYGARADGQFVTDGAITSGQATLTSASGLFKATDVGKGIAIAGAGSGGINLWNVTITGFTNSTTVTISSNASTTVTGALVVWGTDATTPMQNAVNAAANNPAGGSIYFPPGIYLINGPFQTTNRPWAAQVFFPQIDGTAGIRTVQIWGDYPACLVPTGLGYTVPAPVTSPILWSLAYDTGNDGGSAILLGDAYSGSDTAGFTMVQCRLLNMQFRTYPNPHLTAVHFRYMGAAWIDGVSCDGNQTTSDTTTQPTSAHSIGIVLPVNNNAGFCDVGRVFVAGFYSGIEIGEHSTIKNACVQACVYGCRVGGANHGMVVERLLAVHCPNVLTYVGALNGPAASRLDIHELAIEWASNAAPSWIQPVAAIVDASNLGYGVMRYAAVLAGTGYSDTFVKTGGANITATNMGHP